jgi:hypothetical protein
LFPPAKYIDDVSTPSEALLWTVYVIIFVPPQIIELIDENSFLSLAVVICPSCATVAFFFDNTYPFAISTIPLPAITPRMAITTNDTIISIRVNPRLSGVFFFIDRSH